jgi:hypothetical protein
MTRDRKTDAARELKHYVTALSFAESHVELLRNTLQIFDSPVALRVSSQPFELLFRFGHPVSNVVLF